MIVTETLLCQHEFDHANESNCAKAFSVMKESDKTHPLTEAFQVSVGNGDPDESNEEFTSLFDLMTTPPVMDPDCSKPVSIDFALSSGTDQIMYQEWSRIGPTSHDGFNCPDSIVTNQYGPVTILKMADSSCSRQTPRYSDTHFDGVCVDTGAQISVCGKRQAQAYCKSVSIPMTLRPSNLRFKFGNTVSSSLGIMKFRFPCPDGGSIDIDIDIIDLDVPLLLGLRELRSHRILVNYLNNTLQNQKFGWTTKLSDKFGHLYLSLIHI